MGEIKHFIAIEAEPGKVYEALSTSAGLASWWTADARIDPRPGGVAEFGFDRRAVVFRMKVERLEPGRTLVLSCSGDDPHWANTRLTWELEREGGGRKSTTKLRFVQTGLDPLDDYWAACNSTWGELMFRLKGHLEDKRPGPHWRE